jgi:hypothetical protein
MEARLPLFGSVKTTLGAQARVSKGRFTGVENLDFKKSITRFAAVEFRWLSNKIISEQSPFENKFVASGRVPKVLNAIDDN